MLNFAYASLQQEGENAYLIGPVSDRPDSGYLWHYWVPWLALLDRHNLKVWHLDQALLLGIPFVFPLEFRWEVIKWMKRFSKGKTADFLTPHIPAPVFDAARSGTAIILLFFGHEGRSLRLSSRDDRDAPSGYDLILEFMRSNGLPPRAVWFISGNLQGHQEYRTWKRHRFGSEDSPDPFRARYVEPFSHLAQATWREDDRGFEAMVEWRPEENADRTLTHKFTRLALRSRDSSPTSNSIEAGGRSKLFLCMNRAERPHRRAVVCHLLRRGFLERSLVSFQDDGKEAVRFDDAEMQSAWMKLRTLQPLVIDRGLPLDFATYYRTNDSAVKPGEAWPYAKACFSIVTETHFSSDALFVSEKIWKPMRYGHPFLIAGTPGTLEYIRDLGFQTFAPAIDEHYDTIRDEGERMQALFNVIDSLGVLDAKRRADLLETVHSVLLHNMRHLRYLKSPLSELLQEMDIHLSRRAAS